VPSWPATGGDSFDLGAFERQLNRYPQFTTEIDGATIHFSTSARHARTAIPGPAHPRWPGSIVEYLEVIGPLTEPESPSRPCPSMSSSVAARVRLLGPRQPMPVGATSAPPARGLELMHRPRYERYGAIGNDAGSMISPEVGRARRTERVIGVP